MEKFIVDCKDDQDCIRRSDLERAKGIHGDPRIVAQRTCSDDKVCVTSATARKQTNKKRRVIKSKPSSMGLEKKGNTIYDILPIKKEEEDVGTIQWLATPSPSPKTVDSHLSSPTPNLLRVSKKKTPPKPLPKLPEKKWDWKPKQASFLRKFARKSPPILRQLSVKKSKMESLEKNITACRQNYAALKEENLELKKENDQLKEEKKGVEKLKENIKENFLLLKEQYQENNSLKSRIKGLLAEAEQEHALLEREKKRLDIEFKKEMDLLERTYEFDKQKLEISRKEVENELKRVVKELKEREDELEKVRKNLQKENEKIQDENQKIREMRQELQEARAQLKEGQVCKKNIVKLEKEIKKSVSKNDDSKVIAKLKAQLKAERAKLRKLKKKSPPKQIKVSVKQQLNINHPKKAKKNKKAKK